MTSRNFNHNELPNWAYKFLCWYCDPLKFENVHGDLEELFNYEKKALSPGKARLNYILQVLGLTRNFMFGNKSPHKKNHFGMFKNYFVIAYRNLLRNKTYSAINISGLSIGLASSLLIVLFVLSELNYDEFHPQAENIYRVTNYRILSNTSDNLTTTPLPLGPVITSEFEEVENYVRLLNEIEPIIKYEDKLFVEKKFFFTDPSFFEVFGYGLESGDPSTVLEAPNSIVVSKDVVNRYFEGKDPIGETIIFRKWGQDQSFVVSGILKNQPEKSHLSFDFLAKQESNQNLWHGMHGKDWFYTEGARTYIKLGRFNDRFSLESLLPDFVSRHFPETVKGGTNLKLQKITDIHLHSHLDNEFKANGNIIYIYVYTAIAILVLLAACINFMNLATARSTLRAKEVGIRKVMGAYRNQLVMQFMGEAFIMTIISLGLALLIVFLVLPYYNLLIGKNLELRFTDGGFTLIIVLGIGLISGLLSGSYPAFMLSAFKPVDTLKGSISNSITGSFLRKVLVTMQFVITLLLLIGLGVINDQLDYIKSKDLGYTSDQVIYLDGGNVPRNQLHIFKEEIMRNTDIKMASATPSLPGSQKYGPSTGVFKPDDIDRNFQMKVAIVDYQYFDLFSLEIIEGRKFNPESDYDIRNSYLVNEAAANKLGWSYAEAIDKQLIMFNMLGDSVGARKVVGIVKDFHYESLHEQIKPLVMRYGPNSWGVAIKINTVRFTETVSDITATWKKIIPEVPPEIVYLDRELESFYLKDQKLGEIIKYFSILAIIVGALGLFGLASFAADQRVKELGIRKVLGASSINLIYLLLKDFNKLAAIGLLVASPLAYFMMQQYLGNFAYQVGQSFWNYILAGAVAMLMVGVTVSYKARRAALVNPVDSLRNE